MSQSVKINRDQVEDILALTPTQQGMLFHSLSSTDSTVYVEQLALWIEGELNVDHMKQALSNVIEHNEILRAVFRWEQVSHPIQIILKSVPLPWSEADLSHLDAKSEQEEACRQLLAKDREQGIDLGLQPFRLLLCKLDCRSFMMVITSHHLLYDGWGQSVLLKELWSAYETISLGKTLTNRRKTKFKVFMDWCNKGNDEEKLQFWKDYLAGINTKTQIDLVKLTDRQERFCGKVHLKLPPELLTEMTACLNKQGLTMAELVYACWGLLLQHFNSTDDVLFGTTVAGRPPEIAGVDEIIGLFINTIPLRITLNDEMSVAQYLSSVADSFRKCSAYNNTSLVDIASSSELQHADHLFDSIVVIENYPVDRMIQESGGSLSITKYEMHEQTHYDYTLVVSGHDTLELGLHYNTEACSAEDAEFMLQTVKQLLIQVVRNGEMKVSELEIGNFVVRDQVEQVNRTSRAYPYDYSITGLFEQQAALHPERVALKYGDTQLTYKELNEKANQLASHLQSEINGSNQVIGIMIERSPELIISLLAILKAGHTYLPIDTDYPEDRIRYLLHQSQAVMILTTGQYRHKAGSHSESSSTVWVDIEELMQRYDGTNSDGIHNLQVPYDPNQLLYILYTSGSTGNPKGVMIKSHAFVNLVHWFIEEFEIDDKDNTLFIAPISFDLAQKNIFATLIAGGCLVLFKPGIYDYHMMSDEIHRNRITLMNCAPSAFYPLISFNEEDSFARLSTLRHVFLGGEPIQLHKLTSWLHSNDCRCELVNTYGPTECTDIASYYRVNPSELDDSDSVPIGKPIYNAKLYVMDHRQRVLPPGFIGELCIGGTGLAAGYYNDSERTAERFVELAHFSAEPIYRTGDLVRWLPDGNLEYIGRQDDQIKINGMRLELGEIEKSLQTIDGIDDAVVNPFSTAQGKVALAAYIVTKDSIDPHQVEQLLGQMLPAYMIPAHYIRMEELPLSPNGKINRKALPKPEASLISRMGGEPSNEIEEWLVELWRKLLSNDQIGTHDSFFDVGGNSLLLIQLHAQIHKAYPGLIQITDLFAYPSVSKLAAYMLSCSNPKQVEQGQKLHGIVFPADYYLHQHERIDDLDKFDIELTDHLVYGLADLCQQLHIQMEELSLAMAIYLLSEITSQSKIVIYTPDQLDEHWIPIEVNVEKLDDFIALFNETKSQLASDNTGHFVRKDQMGYELLEDGCVPVFFSGSKRNESISHMADYGFAIEVLQYRSLITVECAISNRRFKFKQGKARELLDSYVQLLATLVSEYESQQSHA